MWLEAISEPARDACKCPTCGGNVQRREYGEMHAGSYVYDGKRVDIRRKPRDGFSDPVYLDPTTTYFNGGLYRLWPSDRYLSRGGRKLHRDVWADAFGEIPHGCHIHHRDGDPGNNLLANLECMDATEHLRLTWANSPKATATEHFSELARRRAADWHASEEGRLWHKRNAERTKSWTKWKRETKPCAHCKKEFDALVRKNGHAQKYCGPNCKAAACRARRKLEGL